jgi:hypothetical protein
MMAIVVLLATGMALTHYRVAIVGLCAAAAWGLWSLWLLRKQWQEWLVRTIWLAGAGMVTLALVAPWILTVRSSRMSYVAGALAGRSTDLPNVRVELAAWRSINTDYAPWLWASSLIAAVAALWRGRRLVIPLLLWVTLTFLAANPFLIGFAGTGIVTNQLLVLALYIPMSLLVGWLLSVLWQWLGDFRLRGYPAGRAAFVGLVLLATAFGFRRQTTIVDPFYQMVTENDVAALKWIDSNVPDDSHFLANAFPAYNDSLVVGSDAGWWLPYFTRRASNVPPILYSVEALSPEVDRQAYLEVVHDVRASEGEPAALRAAMCQYGLNYVFLGDRQGSVGYGDTQLVKPEWLVENMDFQLLHESGNAQVWSFDTDVCGRLEE